MITALKRLIVGSPMATAQAKHERLAKIPALAIFCSDAISSVAYASERAPAGQSATVLSLYFVTLGGIIALVASPISGMVFDRLGAYPLYIIAMVGSFAAWLILVFTQNKPSISLEV